LSYKQRLGETIEGCVPKMLSHHSLGDTECFFTNDWPSISEDTEDDECGCSVTE